MFKGSPLLYMPLRYSETCAIVLFSVQSLMAPNVPLMSHFCDNGTLLTVMLFIAILRACVLLINTSFYFIITETHYDEIKQKKLQRVMLSRSRDYSEDVLFPKTLF